jgi:hypothetical protein
MAATAISVERAAAGVQSSAVLDFLRKPKQLLIGETNPLDPVFFNYTLREPVGVCSQIIP